LLWLDKNTKPVQLSVILINKTTACTKHNSRYMKKTRTKHNVTCLESLDEAACKWR